MNPEGCPDVRVWRVPLDCSPPERLRLAELLSPDERERAARYHFPRDRDHFIVCRARLRLLLGRYLDREPGALQFRYGHAGKPELVESSLSFNVSHSGDLALIAIGGPGRLGIDIEKIRSSSAQPLRGFFSEAEEAALNGLSPELRERAFFACWTRKEAYIKGRGDGLSFALDSFDVSVHPDSPAKLLRVRDDPGETAKWELHSLDVPPDYAATLAVEGHCWRLLSFNWESPEQLS